MGDSPSGDADASRVAVDRMTDPTTATARPPKRSTARPVSGENANIPTMWMLMTRPITSSPASPWAMCSGVITMTLTMTTWPRARVSSPSRAAGMPATTRSPRLTEPWAGPESSPSAMPPPPGLEQRVGPQPHADDGDGEEQPDDREDVGPGERPAGRAGAATGALGPDEVGPEHAADRRRPHHDAEVARAVRRQSRGRLRHNGSGCWMPWRRRRGRSTRAAARSCR